MDIVIALVMAGMLMVIGFYRWILIAYIILSWLASFNVINPHNKFVSIVLDVVTRLVDPVLYRIRSALPFLVVGGIDLSPIVLFFGLDLIKMAILMIGAKYGAGL